LKALIKPIIIDINKSFLELLLIIQINLVSLAVASYV
jgi:hypothetical protein